MTIQNQQACYRDKPGRDFWEQSDEIRFMSLRRNLHISWLSTNGRKFGAQINLTGFFLWELYVYSKQSALIRP